MINSLVKFYNLSSNHLYHYEYRYELNKEKFSSKAPRLILLLTGTRRKCIDWWNFSEGAIILSQMRSSGFSILAICTVRQDYDISMPIQKNLDVYWIYTTLQMWMNDVYYSHFQHYPRLYLFGISRGSHLSALLSRVLPVQAQILHIATGRPPSLFIHSDHDKEMLDRLSIDHQFANWFYFDYCYNIVNSTSNRQCPFIDSDKNYFNPVSPTYFIHQKNDRSYKLSDYTRIISKVKNVAINLGGTRLTHNDALKLYVVYPVKVTPDYMGKHFDRWTCKPWASKLFHEHFRNPKYYASNRTLRTCWCIRTDFTYFDRYPNITKTWSRTKQANYRDYVNDIKKLNASFCETVCGEIMAMHGMASRNNKNILNWLDDIDQQKTFYQTQGFVNRPLRLWMYDKNELVRDVTYLTYQTPMNSSCGRFYHAYQMYSPEYFLQDYFKRLNESHPLSRHNLIWAENPLLADYYIIPHDYVCITTAYYRPTITDSEYASFSTRLRQDYFLPLINNVRMLFPYWNMTSGSNHIIAFTSVRNMGITRDSAILDTLKHVIQLGLTGLRQDLIYDNSAPLYAFKTGTPFYRHNYDIIIPPFNRLQWIRKASFRMNASLNMWYEKKKYLLFFAGTMNNSISSGSARRRLSSLMEKSIGAGKRYEDMIMIDGKKLKTMVLIDGIISRTDYIESIYSSIFHLCPEGFAPWSPRIYESICLGSIPLILAESIVLPFERFIDWHSFSVKINVNNAEDIIDLIMNINELKDYVQGKLKDAAKYFAAFQWPYSPINDQYDRHLFSPERDLNGTIRNIFHYLSLELRCRRLEQFYGLDFDSFSVKSMNARRQACKHHPTICPCYEEQERLAVVESIL